MIRPTARDSEREASTRVSTFGSSAELACCSSCYMMMTSCVFTAEIRVAPMAWKSWQHTHAHTRTHMADDDGVGGGNGEREESERVDVESRMVFGNWNLKTPKNRRKEIRICPGTHAHTTHNIQTPTSTAKHTQAANTVYRHSRTERLGEECKETNI